MKVVGLTAEYPSTAASTAYMHLPDVSPLWSLAMSQIATEHFHSVWELVAQSNETSFYRAGQPRQMPDGWGAKKTLRILGSQNLLCWFPGTKVKSQTNAFHTHKAHSSSEEVSLSVDLMLHYCRFFLQQLRKHIRYLVEFSVRVVLYKVDPKWLHMALVTKFAAAPFLVYLIHRDTQVKRFWNMSANQHVSPWGLSFSREH